MTIPRFPRSWPVIVLAAAVGFIITSTVSIAAPADTIHLGFTDANTTGAGRAWTLENYTVEKWGNDLHLSLRNYATSQFKKGAFTGTAATTFTGAEGFYTLTVDYVDEPDGSSRMTLTVDGKRLSVWYADGIFLQHNRKQIIPHVQLKAGSTITLTGTTSLSEYARINSLEIAPGSPPPATQPDGPKPEVPARQYSLDLVPLNDPGAFADLASVLPEPGREWNDSGVPRNLTDAPTYYFRAVKGDQFRAEVTLDPRFTQEFEYCVRPLPDSSKPVATGRVLVPVGAEGVIECAIERDGLYELRVGGAVMSPTHGLTRAQRVPGSGAWYFFVPPRTPAIRLHAFAIANRETSVVVKDSSGHIVWAGSMSAGGSQDVAIPANQQGKVWWVTYGAINPVFWIEGVPPYCAVRPIDLLVPRELVGEMQPSGHGSGEPPTPDRSVASEATAAKDRPRVTLVCDGRPACVIVTPAAADRETANARRVLQDVLYQISGAQVLNADKPPSDGAAICLGVPEDFPELKNVDLSKLGSQGYLIRTEPNRLLILAGSRVALGQTVYTFLQQLGCRWYFPGKEWQVLPHTRTVEVALDLQGRPGLLVRRIGYGSSTGGELPGQFGRWQMANRLGGISGGIAHSYAAYVPPTLFKEHPEYFAMRDTNKDGIGDERTDKQPCTTDPEVVKLFIAGALKQLEQNPGLEMLSVDANDNTSNMCRCERCRAVGTYSDCAWLIAHQVAEAVRQKYPNRKVWVGLSAYGKHSPPPTLKAERDPDIFVQVATAYNAVSVDTMIAGWGKYAGGLGIRDYYAIPQWGANLPGSSITVTRARESIPRFHSEGMVMINAEACAAWGSAGLGMYVASRLMWEPAADVDAILNEFYLDCFGKAAPAARRYFERWDREKFNPRTLKLALTDLREAMDLADDDGSRKRIAGLVLYLHGLKLEADAAAAPDSARLEAIIAEGDQFLWRVKSVGLLAEGAHLWQLQKEGWPFFTVSEATRILDSDLKDMAGVDAVDVQTRYSRDLEPLPMNIPGANVEGGWVTAHQALWAVRLQKGQQVVIETNGTPGEIDAALTATTPSARQVDAQNLASTKKGDTLQMTAPETGQYDLLVNARRCFYRVVTPLAAMDAERDLARGHILALSEQPETLFFYVPRCTTGFVVGAQTLAGRNLHVAIADGRGASIAAYSTVGGEKVIHVPTGSDQQVWRMSVSGDGPADPTIYLLGIPPYVGVDPAKLLVPRECLPAPQ